jgi:uncharacterized protein YdhG (YjbR/CyaY superfamily)
MDNKKEFNSIDEYILSFPEHMQNKLKELRAIIKELTPGAEERISYRIPTFFLNGNLVHFAGYEKHIGFYPGASGIEAFNSGLTKYTYAKGSVQFPASEPLPVDLIRKIVKFRVDENTGKKKK